MKLPYKPYLPPIHSIEDVNKTLFGVWDQLARVINGQLWFGSIADGQQNIDGITLEQVNTGVANVAFSLTHNLGRIPVGFLVVYTDKATSIYDGGVAWTATTISLKSSTANVRLRVFVF